MSTKIQLSQLEAVSIAELLLSNNDEFHEHKLRWATKLIKASLPEPNLPPIEPD